MVLRGGSSFLFHRRVDFVFGCSIINDSLNPNLTFIVCKFYNITKKKERNRYR